MVGAMARGNVDRHHRADLDRRQVAEADPGDRRLTDRIRARFVHDQLVIEAIGSGRSIRQEPQRLGLGPIRARL
jgi:hypothetical protein